MRRLIRRVARLLRRSGRSPLEEIQDGAAYIRRRYGASESALRDQYSRGWRIR